MKTGICKVCGSDKTSPTMIGGSKFKWCNACGQMDMMQTNADRIRTMSDDELADFLYETETQYIPIDLKVENDWLDWLKQEVE